MSREAWQVGCAAKNFPEGGEPFLPPVFVDENEATRLFQDSYERDFDQFVAGRQEAVKSLADELQTIVPQVQETLLTGMQRGVSEGYVPANALERVTPAFTQTAIQVVDPSILGDDLAVYEQRTDIVTMSADAIDYDPDQTIIHEIGGHKISGGTFKTGDDGTVVRVRRGFVNGEDGVIESGRHYGLDEAVEHHLALSYQHGQFDILEPDERNDRDTSYYEHRKLLAQYVLRAGGVIDLKAITRGSFEDSDEAGAVTTDRRTMVTQARAAYGPGAYYKLNQLYEAMDFDDLSAEELADRIHAPELDEDGSVIRRGYIDTEDLSYAIGPLDFDADEF